MAAALENGKALLTSLWDESPAPEISMIRHRTRHRGVRIFVGTCAAALLIAGLVLHVPTPALHGEGLVVALGLIGVAVLLYVEISRHPATIGWVTTFTLGLGICSIVIAAVQPGGTAVVGTYIAV